MSKNTKNKLMNPLKSEIHEADVVAITSESDDNLEASKNVPIKKPMSDAKKASIDKARNARLEKLKNEREKKDDQKRAIAQIYEKQVEADLKQSFLPKYEKQIKKQILERLKEQKLQELKSQYGIQDNQYEESSEDESSEEEVVYTKTGHRSLKQSFKATSNPLGFDEPQVIKNKSLNKGQPISPESRVSTKRDAFPPPPPPTTIAKPVRQKVPPESRVSTKRDAFPPQTPVVRPRSLQDMYSMWGF
jgi:hypothetical protein